jgi:hypothetical protein
VPTTEQFATHYATLTHDQVLGLAGQIGQLMPEAAAALQDEIKRRGFTNADVSTFADLRIPVDDEALYAGGRVKTAAMNIAFTVGQLLTATFLIPVTTTFFYFTVKPLLLPFLSAESLLHNYSLTAPFFPLQVTMAAVTGIAAVRTRNRFAQHQSAEWVWVLPALWLTFTMLGYAPSAESVWHHFFWSHHYATRRLQIFSTLPALTSVMYATAHFASRKLQK